MLHEEHCPIKILKVLKHFPIMVSSSEEYWRWSHMPSLAHEGWKQCTTTGMSHEQHGSLLEDFQRRFGNNIRKRLLYVTEEHGPRF